MKSLSSRRACQTQEQHSATQHETRQRRVCTRVCHTHTVCVTTSVYVGQEGGLAGAASDVTPNACICLVWLVVDKLTKTERQLLRVPLRPTLNAFARGSACCRTCANSAAKVLLYRTGSKLPPKGSEAATHPHTICQFKAVATRTDCSTAQRSTGLVHLCQRSTAEHKTHHMTSAGHVAALTPCLQDADAKSSKAHKMRMCLYQRTWHSCRVMPSAHLPWLLLEQGTCFLQH